MPTLCRSLALAIVAVSFASPASAALTKAQQACVMTQNASHKNLGATVAKVTNACVKGFAKGAETDLRDCIGSDTGFKIAKAIEKTLLGFLAKCDGVDGDGQPKIPDVFVTDPGSLVSVASLEASRTLHALYGVEADGPALTNAEDKAGATCQAAVVKTITKCADVRRKSFNACKKAALAGKAPFATPVTTPAELAACYGADPKGAIAKACDAPGGKIRATIAKQCVDKGVALTTAFPRCGVTTADALHDCLEPAVACSTCLGVSGADALPIDCDADDDGVANRSCVGTQILVPAYANPCCDDGPAMWADLVTAAAAGSPHLNVILNPASGPGAGPEIDPNYVNVGPVGPLLDVRAAGASIIGYVSTSFATRPIADAKADIDLYYTPSYWRGAGVQVDGIFFDEMSSDLPNVAYYRELRDYVKAKAADALVIANPGQPGTQDTSAGASGFTVMDYATAADVLVTFEGSVDDYLNAYTHPAWVDALPASHFAHLVYDEPTVNGMLDDVGLGDTRKAGMMYVTDDVLSPNPWDSLPSYWFDEVFILGIP